MPVLMNKGTDPTSASWLFYTDRATLEAFAASVVEGRLDSGTLALDENDLAASTKASAPVGVYLDVATLVPAGVDLAALGAKIEKTPEGGREAPESLDPGQAPEPTEEERRSAKERAAAAAEAAERAWAEEKAAELSYEPEAAPRDLRVRMGTTTRATGLAYLDDPGSGSAWNGSLPGLQVLASIVAHMREHGNVPPQTVWFMDKAGVLRMSPAKQVKPMAGNVLSCKL
jgi:hypothetical protein